MIKFPSVHSASSQLIATVKRFPLTVLCAFVGTFCLVMLTHNRWYYSGEPSIKVAMCSELGLCLFLAASLFSESKGYSLLNKMAVQATMLVLVIAYYFSINHYEDFGVESMTRYSLYLIAAHLMVSFAPFLVRNQVNGFWQFNRTLFLRFLLTFLYTTVLYGGICMAMWLLDDLLHVYIGNNYYAYAWFFMMGVFNTLFFLSGVPVNIKELENDNAYLKGLKGFTQFVMLPLVTGFMLILYAYSLRIIIIGSLPKGYVSYLVINFSGLGILSLLLIYPLRNNDENKWIKIFSKWFYIALYPLVVLLAFSIYHRVHEYGITADRYFIVVLAIWLLCIASYFLLSNKENIKLIPVSLAAIAVLASFGPWGAFGVAARSQKGQLENILTTNKILVKGMIDTSAHTVNDSVKNRIESIVEYLIKIDELDMLQPWFKRNLDTLNKKDKDDNRYYSYGDAGKIMKYMGFPEYDYNNEVKEGCGHFELSCMENGTSSENYTVRVVGYDYYSKIYSDKNQYDIQKDDTAKGYTYFIAGGDSFALVPYSQPAKFAIKLKGKIIGAFDMEPKLKEWKTLYDTDKSNNGYMPFNKFEIEAPSYQFDFHFNFTRVSLSTKNDTLYMGSFEGSVLTKIKE
jgi:hypothetical protein